jgi:hypothetical protein
MQTAGVVIMMHLGNDDKECGRQAFSSIEHELILKRVHVSTCDAQHVDAEPHPNTHILT